MSLPAPLVRLLLPIDTWERHTIVAQLVGRPTTVLDVGGVPGQLASFLPDAQVVAANVEEPADVIFEGDTLPFPDESFDAVTSLDVLEHVPPSARARHLTELARVARQRVVACCPLGTEEHVAAERHVAEWYAATLGRRHRFLEEHLERGLPTVAELESTVAKTPAFRFALRYHGDFRRANELFRLGVCARTSPRPRPLAAYARARLRARPDLDLAPVPRKATNRVFLVGERIS